MPVPIGHTTTRQRIMAAILDDIENIRQLKESIMSEEGVKHDQGKAPLSIIPKVGLMGVAQVFAFGAKKYGRNNYKAGMDWTRLIDAGMRHLAAMADGEDNDPESGLPHWAHVCANMMMLGYYMANAKGKDDR